MGTVPTFATEVPGNYLTAALWLASVQLGAGWMVNARPVFHGYQAVTQSIATATATAFLLDSEDYDTDGGHSTSTNTSRYTGQTPGTYLVIASSGWAGNGTGQRRLWIAKNGAAILGSGMSSDQNAVNIHGHTTSTFVVMNGTTDYVEAVGQQASGGALLTASSAPFAASMSVLWIRS